MGVGYINEHDRLSVEWTAGAIFAAKKIAGYYYDLNEDFSHEALMDAFTMRKGVDLLKKDLTETKAAYSYSSRRGWIPFGWNSHDPEVLSMASTGWMVFVHFGFNPFFLPHKQENVSSQIALSQY